MLLKITSLFPRSVGEYREPFLGGGSVLLSAKQSAFASKYWANDLDEDLMCFWNAVSRVSSCAELIKKLLFVQSTFSVEKLRELHKELKIGTHYRTEMDKAFRYFILNRISYSGSTQAGGFSAASAEDRFTKSSIKNLMHLPLVIYDVDLTNYTYESCVKSPGKDVFLFCDPPYFTAKKLYGKNGVLHSIDHEKLANDLRSCGHKFLLTYDDCPQIRELYSWAKVKEFTLQYSMVKADEDNHRRQGQELFIYNYDIPGE